LAGISAKIGEICARIGKDPGDIVLVGVTKYAQAAQINEALGAGLKHIGENKVQDARRKLSALPKSAAQVTKHMIGHLQTNKVRQCLETFDLIQSVDSVKLANAIEAQAEKLDKVADILVQVNTAGEEQKFGVAPADVFELVDHIARLRHVRLLGLMGMAPLGGGEPVTRRCFRDLRLLCDGINQRYKDIPSVHMKYLSMGMTDDFEIALEEGANMVRIGRAIFQ